MRAYKKALANYEKSKNIADQINEKMRTIAQLQKADHPVLMLEEVDHEGYSLRRLLFVMAPIVKCEE